MNEISLLDYFAGQALAGMLADHTCDPVPGKAAELSYNFAHAMVRERCKRHGHMKGQDLWDGGKWIGYVCPVCGEEQKEDKKS